VSQGLQTRYVARSHLNDATSPRGISLVATPPLPSENQNECPPSFAFFVVAVVVS